MAHQSTIDWYNENALGFAKSADLVSHKDMLDYFIDLVMYGKILDVGCGSGRDSNYLDQNGFEVEGIDASSELIKIAKKTKSKYWLSTRRLS